MKWKRQTASDTNWTLQAFPHQFCGSESKSCVWQGSPYRQVLIKGSWVWKVKLSSSRRSAFESHLFFVVVVVKDNLWVCFKYAFLKIYCNTQLLVIDFLDFHWCILLYNKSLVFYKYPLVKLRQYLVYLPSKSCCYQQEK